MKEVSNLLRQAVIAKLSPLVVSGQTVPIQDSFLNPQTTVAKIGNAALTLQ